MVKETLLESDIEAGKILLRELDAQNFQITTAMWFFYPDVGEWKLLLHSPRFDAEGGIASYSKISEIITALGSKMGMLSFNAIKLVYSRDALMAMLKKLAHVSGISLVRVTSNYINGMYVDDALIYRNI